ncbi:MAG: glycosyltransferase [Paracoccaceae bacterium]|nr:glycosyltransferase [Paracoccaceae bacterium]
MPEVAASGVGPDRTAMRLAAVVVTYNRLAHLKLTLARLLAEPVDHVIVVDNGSDDGSRNWLAVQTDLRLHVIEAAENGGGAAGFETGLQAAFDWFDPDWCVIMDDDARPMPGALARFRALDCTDCAAVAAAVRYPQGGVCDMNRPWSNPFAHAGIFLRSVLGGGRMGFHLSDQAYQTGPDTAGVLLAVDGASFVGLFLSRAAVQRVGYPDGRLFIYGDDVLYTLGLTRAGGRIVFAPAIRFEHDCSTLNAPGALFRPLWKTYYLHRNRWFVYRLAAGPVLFWPLIVLMMLKWLANARLLQGAERRLYLRLTRMAITDALCNRRWRPHAQIVAAAAGAAG